MIRRRAHPIATWGLGVASVWLLLSGCQGGPPPQPTPEPSLPPLRFSKLDLQQSDPTGRPWWRLRSNQAVVDPKTRTATVKDLSGELFRDGKPLYRITGAQGQVLQSAGEIRIQGQFIAENLQDKTVITGRELRWQPERNELTLLGNLVLKQPALEVKAQEALIQTALQRVALRRAVQVRTQKPVMDIRGEALDWRWGTERLEASQPVQVIHQTAQIQVNAGRGAVDLRREVINLSSGVQVRRLNNQAQLQADQVQWTIPTQAFSAQGNVQYRQTRPPLAVAGRAAQGNLQQQVIQVQGADTEIYPGS